MNPHTDDSSKNFVLIRHAESLQNKCWNESKQWSYRRYDKEFVDCDLSENGYEQTLLAREAVKNLKVKIVYVSPLRRALLTAREVFKNHPSNPKFIVVPILREKLAAACDVPSDIEKLMKEFPDYDFSLVLKETKNKFLWCLDSFEDEDFTEELRAEIQQKGIEGDMDKIQDYLLDRLAAIEPASLESEEELISRCFRSKRYLIE